MQPRQVRMKKYRFIGTKRRFREAFCKVPECKDISFLNSPQQIAWLKLTQAIMSLWNLGASLLHKSQALLKSTFICMHAVLESKAPTPLEIILQIAGYLHEASLSSGVSPTADMLTLYTFFAGPVAQSDSPGLWSPFLATGAPASDPSGISARYNLHTQKHVSDGACNPCIHTNTQYQYMHESASAVTSNSSPAPYDAQDGAT